MAKQHHKLGESENANGVDLNTVWTLANLVSVLRLLLVPVFLYLLFAGSNFMAFLVFAVASSTDWLDGQIARRTNTVSKLGRLLDPAIDRVLIASGVIGLFIVGRVPFWIVLVLVARDVFLFFGMRYLEKRYHEELRVIFIGKVTTAMLLVGFTSLVLDWPRIPGLGLFNMVDFPGWGSASAALGIWFVYVGIVLSLITAALYVRAGRKVVKERTGVALATHESAREGYFESEQHKGSSTKS